MTPMKIITFLFFDKKWKLENENEIENKLSTSKYVYRNRLYVEISIHCLDLDPIFGKLFSAKQKGLKAAVAGAGGWIEKKTSL